MIEIGEATGLEEARKIINRIRLRAKNSPYVKDFKHSEQDAANYLIGEYPAEAGVRTLPARHYVGNAVWSLLWKVTVSSTWYVGGLLRKP